MWGLNPLLCFEKYFIIIKYVILLSIFNLQGVLAAYFFLDQQKADLKLFHWVPVTCIVLYLITFSIGKMLYDIFFCGCCHISHLHDIECNDGEINFLIAYSYSDQFFWLYFSLSQNNIWGY